MSDLVIHQNSPRTVPCRSTFRTETVLNIDGVDVILYVNSSVNYERLTYKVEPIITMVHGSFEHYSTALSKCLTAATENCKRLLFAHREAHGLGTQAGLFDSFDVEMDELSASGS